MENNNCILKERAQSDDAECTPLLEKVPHGQFSVASEKTRSKLILVTFAIIYVTVAASYSVCAPFYPTEVSIWTIYGRALEQTCFKLQQHLISMHAKYELLRMFGY